MWPQPGDHGLVKCSDTRLRPAVCEDREGLRVWRFADGAWRFVGTSTAHQPREA